MPAGALELPKPNAVTWAEDDNIPEGILTNPEYVDPVMNPNPDIWAELETVPADDSDINPRPVIWADEEIRSDPDWNPKSFICCDDDI